MTFRPTNLLVLLVAWGSCAPVFGQIFGTADEAPRQPMPASNLRTAEAYENTGLLGQGGVAPPTVAQVQFTQPVPAPAPAPAFGQPMFQPQPQPVAPPPANGFGPPPLGATNVQPQPTYVPPAVPGQPGGPYVPGSVVDGLNPGPPNGVPPPGAFPDFPFQQNPGGNSYLSGAEQPLPGTPTDLDIVLQEAQTGRLMIGAGINSNAGLVGNIMIDERNFDWQRFPRSFDDFTNGTAFRGAGQGFRLEAMPGTQVQRYTASFTEPYLFNTAVSMQLSAFYFTRNYFDWNEDRVGARVQFGYRLTPDLTVASQLRYENVDVFQPRIVGVPKLDQAVGNNDLAGARFSITHDTRDHVFTPSEGYYIQMAYEQVFGSFDYPQGEIDVRRYFLLSQRPDMSGRHTLGWSNKVGVSGSQTPIFENYFAGGYSTLRGFDFRGASPREQGVTVGGPFQFLGSVEYMFPLTADDMLKGIMFCDYGTVEEQIQVKPENFRVSLGAGMRINVPAMGPAPIALDFATPIHHAPGDNIQIFSFFIGINR